MDMATIMAALLMILLKPRELVFSSPTGRMILIDTCPIQAHRSKILSVTTAAVLDMPSRCWGIGQTLSAKGSIAKSGLRKHQRLNASRQLPRNRSNTPRDRKVSAPATNAQ